MNINIKNPMLTQFRVIFALMMREIHTIYGKSRLGYLWAVIHFSAFILTVWAMRVVIHCSTPHGLSIISFLVAGYTVFFSFQEGTIKCTKAIESNASLLTFPQVQPVDIMISRCIVVYATNIISAILIVLIAFFFGYDFYIFDMGGLIFVIFVSFVMTLGFGMIMSALNSYFSFIERILPIIFRILLFTSGVMFSITSFSGKIGDLLFCNPIFQLIELSRVCVSMGYSADFVSRKYLFFIALCSITIGLLLEKLSRKRLML